MKQPRMSGGEHIDKPERLIPEAPVVGLNRVDGTLGEVISPLSSIASNLGPTASTSLTCTLGKRFAYRCRKSGNMLSRFGGAAATFNMPVSPWRSAWARSPTARA